MAQKRGPRFRQDVADAVVEKKCSDCGQVKPRDQFNSNRSNVDGFSHRCRPCERANKRRQYYAKREKILEQVKASAKRRREADIPAWQKKDRDRAKRLYWKDPVKARAKSVSNYQKYAQQARRYASRRYRANIEFFRKYAREYQRTHHQSTRWQAEHPERAREIWRRSKDKNHEKIRAYWRANPDISRANVHARRARIRGNEGRYSAYEWRALCARVGSKCLACGQKRRLTVDHVVPVTHGGSNYISNIQPLCGPCNRSKATKHTDFRPWVAKDVAQLKLPW